MDVMGSDNVNIHIYAYSKGDYVVCDIFSSNNSAKSVDITFNMGMATELNDLYFPCLENTVILFKILDNIKERLTCNIFFSMPNRN